MQPVCFAPCLRALLSRHTPRSHGGELPSHMVGAPSRAVRRSRSRPCPCCCVVRRRTWGLAARTFLAGVPFSMSSVGSFLRARAAFACVYKPHLDRPLRTQRGGRAATCARGPLSQPSPGEPTKQAPMGTLVAASSPPKPSARCAPRARAATLAARLTACGLPSQCTALLHSESPGGSPAAGTPSGSRCGQL